MPFSEFLSKEIFEPLGMTDTAFLGRVSEVALGASALGTVYFLAFFVLENGKTFPAALQISRRGARVREKNRPAGQHGRGSVAFFVFGFTLYPSTLSYSKYTTSPVFFILDTL